jgi:hypothetical protein
MSNSNAVSIVATIEDQRGTPKEHPGGSMFLGFFDVTLLIGTLVFHVSNFTFRRTSGQGDTPKVFAVEFPTEKYTDGKGQERERSIFRPNDADTRKRVTHALKLAYVDHVRARQFLRKQENARKTAAAA